MALPPSADVHQLDDTIVNCLQSTKVDTFRAADRVTKPALPQNFTQQLNEGAHFGKASFDQIYSKRSLAKRANRKWKDETQYGASWNLGIMGEKAPRPGQPWEDLSDPLRSNEVYRHIVHAGAKVVIWMVSTDSEPITTHPDYIRRVKVDNVSKKSANTSSHLTAAASLAIGTSFGIAKEATMTVVSVGDNDIAGLSTALNHILQVCLHTRAEVPCVVLLADMSLPDRLRDFKTVQTALDYLDRNGIPVVAGAGDGNVDLHVSYDTHRGWKTQKDASSYPCMLASIICVGAIDSKYNIRYNRGEPVHLYAPGHAVQAAGLDENGDTARSVASGTSLAAAQVAGVLAVFMSYESFVYGLRPSTNFLRQLLISNTQSYAATSNKAAIDWKYNSRTGIANTGIFKTTRNRPYAVRPVEELMYSGNFYFARRKGATSLEYASFDRGTNLMELDVSVVCMNDPSNLLTEEEATNILFRLSWEQGHLLSIYGRALELGIYTDAVHCADDACVSIKPEYTDGLTTKDLMFEDANILFLVAMEIFTKCKKTRLFRKALYGGSATVHSRNTAFPVPWTMFMGKRQNLVNVQTQLLDSIGITGLERWV